MKSWLKILLGFKQGYFYFYDHGLTIRFIVGVCQLPIGKKFESPELAEETVKQMFDEMKIFNKDGKDDFVVTSSICEIHNGPVMNLSSQKWSEHTIGTTFEEVWECYGSDISEGNYHINKREIDIVKQIFKEVN